MSISPLFLANWKMNMLLGETRMFAEQFLADFQPSPLGDKDTGIAAAFTSLPTLRDCFFGRDGIRLGAQNVHWLNDGAHTGEISAPMLKEHEVDFALCGHSERRQLYGETSLNVARRAIAAIDAGLTAVVCIGETKEDFEEGRTELVVSQMLEASTSGLESSHLPNLVIAYEPVWAIGTGLAATPEIATQVHNGIRASLEKEFDGAAAASTIPILYGGSIKPENIADLMKEKNINGGLIGGASLKPDSFNGIIQAGRAANA